jgi:hypothetical protein
MARARARQAQWTDPPRAVRAAHAHARIADTDMTARLLVDAHELAAQQSVSPPLAADTPLSGFLVGCWEARC